MTIVWPPTGRKLETSQSSFDRVYSGEGWKLLERPAAQSAQDADAGDEADDQGETSPEEQDEGTTAGETKPPAKKPAGRRGRKS